MILLTTLDQVKVVVLPSWYPSKSNDLAGIFIKEQVKYLMESGVSCAVLKSEQSYNQIFSRAEIFNCIEDGIEVFRLYGFCPPKLNLTLLQYWAKTQLNLFEAYVEKYDFPDIVHAHSFISGAFGVLIKEKFNIPLVLTEHHQSLLWENKKRRYCKFYSFVYNKADKLIAVSNELKRGMSEFTSNSIDVIPNLVDTQLFKKKDQNEYVASVILAVGHFDDNKHFSSLIEVMPTILQQSKVNIKLKLVGNGPNLRLFKNRIKELSIEGHVSLESGIFSKEKLRSYYEEADVCCLPSKHETFGMVLIEALACGVPVIASGGGPRDIINEKNGIYLEEVTKGNLSSAILNVLDNKENYNADWISNDVEKRFGKDKVISQIVKVYERLK